MIEITYRGHNSDIRAVINPRYISLVDDLHGEPRVHMERGMSGFVLERLGSPLAGGVDVLGFLRRIKYEHAERGVQR